MITKTFPNKQLMKYITMTILKQDNQQDNLYQGMLG